ncbi:MAG: hypothetical protein KAQ78_11425 [Candidatus Latescibacteria bacterium]|nr:hypothetical protein [Candidatus Latescibacterota bacterium]
MFELEEASGEAEKGGLHERRRTKEEKRKIDFQSLEDFGNLHLIPSYSGFSTFRASSEISGQP